MRDSHGIIDRLSPEDALVILKALARDGEQIAARIAEIALAHLSDVNWAILSQFSKKISASKNTRVVA